MTHPRHTQEDHFAPTLDLSATHSDLTIFQSIYVCVCAEKKKKLEGNPMKYHDNKSSCLGVKMTADTLSVPFHQKM